MHFYFVLAEEPERLEHASKNLEFKILNILEKFKVFL